MSDAYKQAGVDIAAAQQATEMMKSAVRATYTPQVLSHVGSFGGLFDVSALKTMQQPLLVASTDGVGTKTMVAAEMGRYDTVGQDLVNHCINDILVQGAQPLFFLDYVASSKLEPTTFAAIVQGMAIACSEAGVALIGGESAEMPGVYMDGEVDVAGTIIGAVDRPELIDGSAIAEGDVVLGLPSTGLHTNGYSLARRVLGLFDWHAVHDELGVRIGDALLEIHKCYVHEVAQLRAAGVGIRGLAHITGGGITDNLPRILPTGLGAEIERGAWVEPPIFGLIQRLGNIADADMFHAFNMGVGMCVVVAAAEVEQAQRVLGDGVCVIGRITTTEGINIK